ncbi:transglycosylase SLT domain-containing protein [Salimicrobium flavidum]|uniref:Transglycosylase SLT domain-containing protein n=1 Tax=Salimicrobium flavidum TaxID=570947 RepID=A0A1N7JWZ6_9BACI|nr:transglycosylase SLT domain-containing protein [Salimicrobium flavidum]SIS53858.1 Transglycosylase SLT domain-containing protein [Salimicrobium flavidum]
MKKWIAIGIACLLALTSSPLSAEEKMSHKEILTTIVEVANENDIPAEIMIAIASKESGADGEYFRHYDENGDVIMTDDGGIGLMQITELSDTDYSAEELKDIENNIRAAADVLNAKWNYIGTRIPEVKTWAYQTGKASYTEKPERDVIEHWYFPVMAYNGLAETNVPKDHNEITYQDAVFQSIEQNGELFYSDDSNEESHAEEISEAMSDYFEEGETYDVGEDSGHVTFTDEKSVKLEKEGTYTRMDNFEADKLIAFNRNPTSTSKINVYDSELLNNSTSRGFYNEFSVLNKPLVFKDNDASHYGYYTVEENGEEKFISSSNLINSSHPYATTTFEPLEKTEDVVTVSNEYVSVDFNEKIDDRYLNQRNFYLKDSEGNGLRASINNSEEGDYFTVQINPIMEINKDETYTLYVHKVRDEEGNMASPVKQKIKFE